MMTDPKRFTAYILNLNPSHGIIATERAVDVRFELWVSPGQRVKQYVISFVRRCLSRLLLKNQIAGCADDKGVKGIDVWVQGLQFVKQKAQFQVGPKHTQKLVVLVDRRQQ